MARKIAEKAGVPFEVLDVSLMAQLTDNSLTNPELKMDEEKPENSYPNTFVPGRNMGLPEREDFITAIHRCFFDLQEQDGAAFYLPKRLELDAQSGESIPLTWESSTFGGLSSGKGIHFLKGKLREMIALTRHSFPVH